MSPESPAPRALSFGETVIDVYPDRRVVAGSPLHLAAHLAVRGWEVELATRVGNDPEGAAVRRTMARYGISQAFVETDDVLPTGTVTIHLLAGGHSFTIHKPAAWDALTMAGPLPSAHVLCYGTLIGRSPRSRAALLRLLDGARFPMRVLDVNLRPPDVDSETVRSGLGAATVVKVGGDELEGMTKIVGLPPEPAALFEVAPDLEWIALTHGPEGAELLHAAGARWRLDAPRVALVDAVGAGDAFTAGLVDALGRGATGEVALASAVSAAGTILGQRGGLPPLD